MPTLRNGVSPSSGRSGCCHRKLAIRAEQKGDGAPVGGDVGPEVLVPVALPEHHGGAVDHRGVADCPLAAEVEERQSAGVGTIRGLEREDLGRRIGVGEGVGVRGAHALRGAGGARGEHDPDEVVKGGRGLEGRLVVGNELLECRRPAASGESRRQRQLATPARILGVEDAVLERFELVRDLFEPGQKATIDDDRPGGGIIADAAQDPLAVGEVYRHLHCPALAQPAPDDEVVDNVGQHHQDRLLVRDPERGGAVRETVGEAVHLAVAYPLSGDRLHEGLVPEAFRRAFEHPAHGALLERVVRGHEWVHHRSSLNRMSTPLSVARSTTRSGSAGSGPDPFS